MILFGKSLGVYGDSFAVSPTKECEKFSWSTILANKSKCKDYENYGFSGSSFYYTFKKFKENFKKHDCNIVLVTDPYRYTKNLIHLESQNQYLVPTISRIETALKTLKLSFNEKVTLNEIKSWHLALDRDYTLDMHVLMIEEIKRLDPNVILLPCFQWSFPDYQGVSFFDLCTHQIKLLGGDETKVYVNYEDNTETLSGHLSEEFNIWVAQTVFNGLKTGKVELTKPKNIKLKYSFENYYNKIS